MIYFIRDHIIPSLIVLDNWVPTTWLISQPNCGSEWWDESMFILCNLTNQKFILATLGWFTFHIVKSPTNCTVWFGQTHPILYSEKYDESLFILYDAFSYCMMCVSQTIITLDIKMIHDSYYKNLPSYSMIFSIIYIKFYSTSFLLTFHLISLIFF